MLPVLHNALHTFLSDPVVLLQLNVHDVEVYNMTIFHLQAGHIGADCCACCLHGRQPSVSESTVRLWREYQHPFIAGGIT